MIEGEETDFLYDLNETLIRMSKNRMEACPKMSYDLAFQSNQGPIFSCHIMKMPKYWKKLTLDWSKFKFQNRLKQKNIHFWVFLDINFSLSAKPPKKGVNMLANSETWIKY